MIPPPRGAFFRSAPPHPGAEDPTRADLHRLVDRLLRDAGAYHRFPTPIDDIVAAAGLRDADDYVLDESLVAQLPAKMQALLRSARRKVQGLVDRRELVIHVDPAVQNQHKRGFIRLHETTHHLLPHQRDLLYADDHETLSASTRMEFEREANQGAAELLFQRTGFSDDARDLEVSADAITALSARYGASFHAAFRRYTETHRDPVAGIVLSTSPENGPSRTWQRKECMATDAWQARFGPSCWPYRMSESEFPFLAALGAPPIRSTTLLTDLTGEAVAIEVDTLTTPFSSFVLLVGPQPRRLLARRPVRVVSPS